MPDLGYLDTLPVNVDRSVFEKKTDPNVSASSSDWSKEDISRQIALTLLGLADWNQSKIIAKNPSEHYEANPFLPKYPSQGQFNNITAATLIGHFALSDALSPEWRKIFQRGSIGLEGLNVYLNHRK